MGQTNFLQSLGWAILNSLWQLAFLWVIYQLITVIFKNAKSSFRSFLASGLLMTGFAWFIFTFFSTYLNPGTEQVSSSIFVNPQANESVNNWLQKTLPFASVVYLVLLVFPVMHFVRNYRYVQVIRRFGLTKIDVSWRMFVSRVSGQMNIRKKVSIWVSEFVSSPVTIGFLKPIILVPLAAINHLTPQQLEAVLLHELSHIRRMDYLINLLINVIQSVLYFNPFVKGFVKIIEREREKSCDEMVLQFQYNAHEYATALLTLEQSNQPNKAFIIGATGKKNDLLHRVERIMGIQKKPAYSFQKLAGMMAGLLCIIALQALLLFASETNGKSISAFKSISSPSLLAAIQARGSNHDLKSGTEQPNNSVRHGVAYNPGKVPARVEFASPNIANSDFIQASLEFSNTPELKKYQEEQVDQAMAAIKKVIETVQWKSAEKNLADVFTQKEKEVIKATYDKKVKKIDLTKLDDKLKLAYNNIDWDKLKDQLSTAVSQVRIDSMQHAYHKTIDNIDEVSSELKLNDLRVVPDTDVSLEKLQSKKDEINKALNELKAARTKKIVRL